MTWTKFWTSGDFFQLKNSKTHNSKTRNFKKLKVCYSFAAIWLFYSMTRHSMVAQVSQRTCIAAWLKNGIIELPSLGHCILLMWLFCLALHRCRSLVQPWVKKGERVKFDASNLSFLSSNPALTFESLKNISQRKTFVNSLDVWQAINGYPGNLKKYFHHSSSNQIAW